MNKFLLIVCLFLFGFSFSQEKKIEFSKELRYESVSSKKDFRGMLPAFKILGNNKGEFLTTVNITSYPINLFSGILGMTPVNVGLDNKLTYSTFINTFMGIDGSNKKDGKIVIQNLKTKETILGNSCNNYLFTISNKSSQYNDENDSTDGAVKVCIDEKNALNNVPVFIGIFNQMQNGKFPSPDVKGLILKISIDKSDPNSFIQLTSTKDKNNFVYFDHKMALKQEKSAIDSLIALRKEYEREYPAEYAADSTMVVADSAAVMVDSVATDYAGNYDDAESAILPYESVYKKRESEPSYAVKNMRNKDLFGGIPKHCLNFDKDIPVLDNKKYRSHLSNYVGQMCDLYLGSIENSSVDFKGTVDEVRREILYFNKEENNLNKSDKKKVKNYLENLD